MNGRKRRSTKTPKEMALACVAFIALSFVLFPAWDWLWATLVSNRVYIFDLKKNIGEAVQWGALMTIAYCYFPNKRAAKQEESEK